MQIEEHTDVPEGMGNRQETLERYRHLRAINKEHHSEIMKHLPKKSFLTWAKRIGLIKGKKTLVANNLSEVNLVSDLAIYSSRMSNTTEVERHRRRAEYPEDSDEAIVLNAMCHSRFAFFQTERRHAVAGLIVNDLFRKEEIWLMDEGFEETVPGGFAFASRLIKPGEYYMTTGAAIPIDEDVVDEIAAVCPNMSPDTITNERKNVRFIEAVYKTAIKIGSMDNISYE